MKKLAILITLQAVFLCTVAAQQRSPQSYPINNTPTTERGKTFAAAFNEQDVGNLHVYATPEQRVDYEYYFLGDQLPRQTLRMFDRDMRRQLRREKSTLYATYVIRGDNDAFYIVRTYHPDRGSRLELFDLERGKLNHLKTLAYNSCNGSRCTQLDSWVLDLDGDTRLDVVRKFRITDPVSGEVVEEYAEVYAQRDGGILDRTDNLYAPLDTFVMEDFDEEEDDSLGGSDERD